MAQQIATHTPPHIIHTFALAINHTTVITIRLVASVVVVVVVGLLLGLPLQPGLALLIVLEVVLVVLHHRRLVELLELGQHPLLLVFYVVEDDLVLRLPPPPHVLEQCRKLSDLGLVGQHLPVLLKQPEGQEGRHQVDGVLLLLAEEVVEALVEVLQELFLTQPVGGHLAVLGPEDDPREDVADRNAGRLVETPSQHVETEFSYPLVGLELQQVRVAPRGRQQPCGHVCQQVEVALLVEVLEEGEEAAVEFPQHAHALPDSLLHEEHVDHHEVALGESAGPLVGLAEDGLEHGLLLGGDLLLVELDEGLGLEGEEGGEGGLAEAADAADVLEGGGPVAVDLHDVEDEADEGLDVLEVEDDLALDVLDEGVQLVHVALGEPELLHQQRYDRDHRRAHPVPVVVLVLLAHHEDAHRLAVVVPAVALHQPQEQPRVRRPQLAYHRVRHLVGQALHQRTDARRHHHLEPLARLYRGREDLGEDEQGAGRQGPPDVVVVEHLEDVAHHRRLHLDLVLCEAVQENEVVLLVEHRKGVARELFKYPLQPRVRLGLVVPEEYRVEYFTFIADNLLILANSGWWKMCVSSWGLGLIAVKMCLRKWDCCSCMIWDTSRISSSPMKIFRKYLSSVVLVICPTFCSMKVKNFIASSRQNYPLFFPLSSTFEFLRMSIVVSMRMSPSSWAAMPDIFSAHSSAWLLNSRRHPQMLKKQSMSMSLWKSEWEEGLNTLSPSSQLTERQSMNGACFCQLRSSTRLWQVYHSSTKPYFSDLRNYQLRMAVMSFQLWQKHSRNRERQYSIGALARYFPMSIFMTLGRWGPYLSFMTSPMPSQAPAQSPSIRIDRDSSTWVSARLRHCASMSGYCPLCQCFSLIWKAEFLDYVGSLRFIRLTCYKQHDDSHRSGDGSSGDHHRNSEGLSSLVVVIRNSSFMLPHPEKVEKGGEDAYYAGSELLVVADGVGGWNERGVDPRFYSRTLSQHSAKLYGSNPSHYAQQPIDLILESHAANKHPGSSTMSVVTLVNDQLRTCHIGDCRLYVFRRYGDAYRIIYESVDQLNGFNFPFQLAGNKYGNDPSNALCGSFQVKSGDLVILASDGLADNLFTHEIAELAEKSYQKRELDQLPLILAKEAARIALRDDVQSPFSRKAREWGIEYKGGKQDDTTVIVAPVIEEDYDL